ncbi:MAG: hypothetical protein DI598_16145 [Pseudopedobacter saltans]|uniref:Carrier domain-containing protein n=1 Tax=Pseudopedobacter saltans TaxID=151895 RepID=A0A2W5GC03_9SPHI|nr:MAG: hypothetical protein DI598_16145 [Pseudopedobacter saltans]
MGLDSYDIWMRVENTFKIRIPNEEARRILTVGDFHAVTWKYLQKSPTEKNRRTRPEMELIVNKVIADIGGLDIEEVTSEKKIADDLGID